MSFEDRVSEVVQGILSDSTQLPAEFVSSLPQIVAQNPVPTAKTSGVRLAYGTHTSSVSTTGTTFGTGTDLLSTALEFTATGSNSYIIRVHADGWSNGTATAACFLQLNLDGADNGFMAAITAPGASYAVPCSGTALITPAAGTHSVNVRLVVSAGTGTVNGGSGGTGAHNQIIVTIEVA